MNKICVAVLLATTMASGMALADNHTVSIGYAQSKVQNFDDINGVNLQYRYEFNSPLSVVASFSYMQGDGEQNYLYYGDSIKNSVDVKYYSLLVGPAYRINNYVSLYALGGAAYVKASGSTKWINVGDVTANYEDISEKSASFAYGAGVIINPVENLSVNIGYEGTQADLAGNYSINGFNVGIGYRF